MQSKKSLGETQKLQNSKSHKVENQAKLAPFTGLMNGEIRIRGKNALCCQEPRKLRLKAVCRKTMP